MEQLTMHANYLSTAFDQATLIRDFGQHKPNIEFQALVGMGISGAIAVPVLAHTFGFQFGIVRKQGVSNHSGNLVETNFDKEAGWIIVDDLICYGNTVRYIIRTMKYYGFNNYQGVYLYGGEFSNPGFRGKLFEDLIGEVPLWT
jgi:orotate phosphoribosyltransferase